MQQSSDVHGLARAHADGTVRNLGFSRSHGTENRARQMANADDPRGSENEHLRSRARIDPRDALARDRRGTPFPHPLRHNIRIRIIIIIIIRFFSTATVVYADPFGHAQYRKCMGIRHI